MIQTEFKYLLNRRRNNRVPQVAILTWINEKRKWFLLCEYLEELK